MSTSSDVSGKEPETPAPPAKATNTQSKEPETPAPPAKATNTQSKDTPADSEYKPKGKRGRFELSVEFEGECSATMIIKIPPQLIVWLVNDGEAITKQQKLAILPARLTVSQILDNYIAYKMWNQSHNHEKLFTLMDITQAIKEYFNRTLESKLLYNFERPQYSEILQEYPNTPVCRIYGSIHLLRLFVKLGPILENAYYNKKSLQLFLIHIHNFLKYMETNKSTLFNLQDYRNATPEYRKKIK